MTSMFGLEWIDLAVIVIYFAVVIAIGFRAMRNIRSQEDYFLGGRLSPGGADEQR